MGADMLDIDWAESVGSELHESVVYGRVLCKGVWVSVVQRMLCRCSGLKSKVRVCSMEAGDVCREQAR